jgi:ubiquinone biosynthesis protein
MPDDEETVIRVVPADAEPQVADDGEETLVEPSQALHARRALPAPSPSGSGKESAPPPHPGQGGGSIPDAVPGATAQAEREAAEAATQPRPNAKKPQGFVFDPLRPYKGLFRRFFVVYKHVLGLLAGGAVAYVRSLPRDRRKGLKSWFPRLSASLFWPFLDKQIRRLPFPQQLRRRLEILGPTYIKLGQIMAIREDLLPRGVTTELANLFDRLPPIPFVQVREIIEENLERPLSSVFRWVDENPLGSASIAQAHLAETVDGEKVVFKVIKPGIREVIEQDLTLLRLVGIFLQWVIPRYQPRQIVAEFSAYTIKEVDYTYEADHAESFDANFRDMPDVVFPKVYRQYSSTEVLTMEFMDGFKPGSGPSLEMTEEHRRRVIDLGAASIIRMLYQDGFFHADLHAGNLMILPQPNGRPPKVAFIDLGMVGRFEERTRRMMLYYFYALVNGDVDGATRYITEMATVGKGGDPHGFRRAVADLSRRFRSQSSSGDFSIAQLILESVGLGGKYRVFFPVEMTLMVKALVTFEGVGRTLDPHLDIAAVSQKHVTRIFQHQFNPKLLVKEILRGAPELVDMAVRLPQLLSAGFKFAEENLNNRAPQNPLAGIRSSIIAAACIVGGVIGVIQGAAEWLWLTLFSLALLLTLFGK